MYNLRHSVYEKLQGMRNKLIQQIKITKKCSPCLEAIDKALCVYKIEVENFNKSWQSNREILIEFRNNFLDSRGKTISEAMYIKLFNAIYEELE